MSSNKRKLRPAAVLAIILLVCVIVLAAVIVVKFINYGSNLEEDELLTPDSFVDQNDTVNSDTDTQGGDEDEPDDNNQDENATPEEDVEEPSPEENLPVINNDAPQPVYTQSQLLEMYPGTVLDVTDDSGVEYIDDIYFVGDSTTHGMKYYGVLSGGKETDKVWTPKSGTLAMWNLLTEKIVMGDGSEFTIPDAVDLTKPSYIVFTLGVNGVSSCSKEQFTGYYKDLITAVKDKSPDTVIILQSIYPVCSDYQYVNSISMEKINNANVWIAELAHQIGCYYLNTASILVDDSGYLNPAYSNGDGIHISPEGFSLILNYIRTHAYLG